MESLDLFSQIENVQPSATEGKDFGCKWNFVERNPSSSEQGSEDSSFKPFRSHPLRCLVREYIQNSLDAHDDEKFGIPVKVVFSIGELLCSDYPQLIKSLPQRLKACSDYCHSFNNGQDPYKEKLEYVNSHLLDKLGYLKVSDYNTTGMPYNYDRFKSSTFKACVKGSGASHKGSGHAGGSHGIGKTVGFVNSGINAVYYCTKTKRGDTYGEGVIKLCDHDLLVNGEKIRYENVAFYDSKNGVHPDSGNDIPEEFRKERTEPGTDAFVIGIELTEEDVLIMKKEILRSFFKSFFDNLLSVEICGEAINQSNVAGMLIACFSEEGDFDRIRARDIEIKFNPRPYYLEVLSKQGTDNNHCMFDSCIDFPNKYPNLGHALLYMWKSDSIRHANSRDSVVYMRDNNMVIEVRRGRNNKGYYAVFFCDGDGSEILRRMENATHDKWDIEELRDESKDIKKQAERTLQEIKDFVSACEQRMFPEDDDEERIISSLRNRRVSVLGDHKRNEDEESLWPSTNITERIKATKQNGRSSILETLSGRRKKKKAKGKPTTVETNIGPSITPVGPDTPIPTPPTPPTPPPIPPTPPTPTPPYGIPETPDGPIVGGEGNVEGRSSEIEDTGIRMREIKLDGRSRHLIPLHDGEFACKLVLSVPREYENCRIELFVQGVTGQIPLSLSRVSDGCKIGGVDSNEILDFNLIPGNNSIKFTPVERVKNYTLIIKAYGN